MRTRPILYGYLVTAGALACRRGPVQGLRFWSQGASYVLTLTPLNKAGLVPELKKALGSAKDSVVGSMTIDSIVGDSTFGRIDLKVGEIGLMEPMSGGGPPEFAAQTVGDSVRLRLNSQQTDVGIWLDGKIRGRRAEGTWVAGQRHVSGRFRIIREPR